MQSGVFLLALAAFGLAGDGSRAERTDWWSLAPIARPDVPEPSPSWGRTPIDRFIAAKLHEHQLDPSPEADARTLIRRLTYDLHGLPPTPAEVEEFVNDDRPDAYERLVDRLLESPRFGERWARHWLDVVHYGETHGYDKDKPRPNAWPYRDYVIRALNADKPFAQFVQEQIAGDVLFPGEPDATVATGFIAAGPWDFVGHVELPESKTDGLIARYNDRDDMVATTMSTFASLTVHCARCHDHKFDPITQEDYYRLQAVFAGVDRADRPFDYAKVHHEKRSRLMAETAVVHRELRGIEQKLQAVKSPEIEKLDQRLVEVNAELSKLEKARVSPTNGYHSAIMPVAEQEKWVQVDLGRELPIDEVRIVPARPTDFPDTPGFGYPLRYHVDLANDAAFSIADRIVDRTSQDQANPGDRPIVVPGGGRRARYVRITATRLWKRSNDFVFALAELEVMSSGSNVARGAAVSALDSIEAGRWGVKNLVDGFSSRTALDSVAAVPERARGRLESELSELQALRQEQLEKQLSVEDRSRLHWLKGRVSELGGELAELPAPSLVYAATSIFTAQGNFKPASNPRTVHLLGRGDVRQPGKPMSPGSIAAVAALNRNFELSDPNDEGARRAALARWITHRQNPLTWRSIVNRVWQYHFGRGIVDSPNDFGRMGEPPTHPELLDWLAQWFLDNGQSMKALHRLIVTSSVYRQSSRAENSSHGAVVDRDNRFLWRMNRMRLDAESIRDSMLFVAGRLELAMGGPSVQQFYFKDDHSPVYDYTQFDWDSAAARRRSIYRFIVRSVPDPFMDSFDCPDASQLVPKRNTTLTALQALSLLNNPFVISQAEHLARRVERETDGLADQAALAFRLSLSRSPSHDEWNDLAGYADRHGLVNACRLLLNSNEFIFID